MDFTKPITNLDEGKAFIQELHATGNMFHFEDSPASIGNTDRLDRWNFSWTPDECEALAERVAELYALDWAPVAEECPIGYALTVMGHTGHHDEVVDGDAQGFAKRLMAVSDADLRAMLTEAPPSALDIGASGEVPRIVSDQMVTYAHGAALMMVKAEMQRRGIE